MHMMHDRRALPNRGHHPRLRGGSPTPRRAGVSARRLMRHPSDVAATRKSAADLAPGPRLPRLCRARRRGLPRLTAAYCGLPRQKSIASPSPLTTDPPRNASVTPALPVTGCCGLLRLVTCCYGVHFFPALNNRSPAKSAQRDRLLVPHSQRACIAPWTSFPISGSPPPLSGWNPHLPGWICGWIPTATRVKPRKTA